MVIYVIGEDLNDTHDIFHVERNNINYTCSNEECATSHHLASLIPKITRKKLY